MKERRKFSFKLHGAEGESVVTPDSVKIRTLFGILSDIEELLEASSSLVETDMSDVVAFRINTINEGSVRFDGEAYSSAIQALEYLEGYRNDDGNFVDVPADIAKNLKSLRSKLKQHQMKLTSFEKDHETEIVFNLDASVKIKEKKEPKRSCFTSITGTCRSIFLEEKAISISTNLGETIKATGLSKSQMNTVIKAIGERRETVFLIDGDCSYDPETMELKAMTSVQNINVLDGVSPGGLISELRSDYAGILDGLSVEEVMRNLRGYEDTN